MVFISSRQCTSLSRQNLCTHDTHFRKIKGVIYKEMQYINVKPQAGLASSSLFSYTIFYEKLKKKTTIRCFIQPQKLMHMQT